MQNLQIRQEFEVVIRQREALLEEQLSESKKRKTVLTSLEPVPQPKPNAPKAPVTMIHVYLRRNNNKS
jgi:hypothetical protein